MNKAATYSYRGMNQDANKALFPKEFYFEGKNIRIVATDSQTTGAVTNEKGNSLIYSIPIPVIDYGKQDITYISDTEENSKTLHYTTEEITAMSQLDPSQPQLQYIIGHTTTRRYVILFTSDESGFDCIWKIDLESPTYDITLLYIRTMLFSRDHPIQALNNFENRVIDKVYWVDGLHQMRFINIEHSELNRDLDALIDVPISTIDMVGEFDLSQPIIDRILAGGIHTAGMIQYAYNLYRLNSSQTRLSPLSQLVALDKGSLGGGALNEVVGASPVVKIDDIDKDYTHIKTYSIKYTSLNQSPTISIIDDREIPSSRSIEVFDDGNTIASVTLEEFLFLGSDILVPKHINSKDNRLFLANYEERNFDVDLDTRAYSFDGFRQCFVYDNIRVFEVGDSTINVYGITGDQTQVFPDTFELDEKSDAINLDYDAFTYQTDGVTPGGEGLYVKYKLSRSNQFNPDARYFKDNEIYRLGIEFINTFGQYSLPKWIADFKAKEGNLEGLYNTLTFELKPSFYSWLTSTEFETEYDKPVGYRVLIAERTINDRTIVANGMLSPMMINDKSTKDVGYPVDVDYVKKKADTIPKLPNLLIRNTGPIGGTWSRNFGANTRPLELAQNLQQMSVLRESADTEFPRAYFGNIDTKGRFYQYNAMYQIYSPELIFNESAQLSSGLQLRLKGGMVNKYNTVWGKTYTSSAEVVHEGKGLNGVSLTFADTLTTIKGDGANTTSFGIICHPNGSDANKVAFLSFYRGYGDVEVNDTFAPNNIVAFTEPFVASVGVLNPPGYPEEVIRFESNNRDVIITTKDDNCHVQITYVIVPKPAFVTIPYTASICADINGNNVITSASGPGSVSPFVFSVKPDITETEEWHYFLKIITTAHIEFDITVEAKVLEFPSNTPFVEAESGTVPNIVFVNTDGVDFPSNYYVKSSDSLSYEVYGIPEITVRGQNVVNYNNDSNYKYINTFLDILSDKDTSFGDDGQFGRAIITGNSDGNRCITFVLGADDPQLKFYNRPLLEQLYQAGFDPEDKNLGLIGELVKNREQIYLGNIYGGNSWEDKKRTKYLEIGDYQEFNISPTVNVIESPGDTFVNFFKFQRVIPKQPAVYQQGAPSWQEIVEFKTESTIDMKNRNDVSFSTWDSKFHYTEAEYQQYNKVYSQQNNLMAQRDLDFNVKKVNSFDTNVIATKQKSAGEIIDSWTDVLQNEVITLDGKFGAINAFPGFNDELYTIQDKAFAFLSINPRVQVQGNDGLAIELGTGQVLSDYKYITTDSGTLNKWGVVASPMGIYYYDALNSAFNAFKGNIAGLSDTKGLHTFFINNTSLNDLKTDNPLLQLGISSGYDYVNNDVFFTFRQNTESNFTFAFNELTDSFTSFYDYLPSMYISKGQFLIAVNPEDDKLYRQYAGKYNEYFGRMYKSSITFNVNPEPYFDCVFDNINFKSEVYVDNIDQPDKTLTSIQAFDDYQDSGLVKLIVGRNNNLRRKFRDWNAIIPRSNRNRIRAPWIKLKVEFDNSLDDNNYRFVLHNMNIYYTI